MPGPDVSSAGAGMSGQGLDRAAGGAHGTCCPEKNGVASYRIGEAETGRVREEGGRSIWTRGGHSRPDKSGVGEGRAETESSTGGWEGAGEVARGRCVHRNERSRPGHPEVTGTGGEEKPEEGPRR